MHATGKSVLITLLVCGATHVGCRDQIPSGPSSVGGQSTARPITDPEALIKEKQFNTRFELAVRPLSVVREIEPVSGRDSTLVYPVSLAVSRAEGIFISDNNAQAIVHSPLNSSVLLTLPTEGGSGRLLWPNSIEAWQHQVAVVDNDGIKFFGPDGSFKRLVRIYYQVNHFTIRQDGGIYVNAFFRNNNPSNPLIVELNKDGKRVRGFGVRQSRPGLLGLGDEAYLCTSGRYLIAVFRHRPTVQIYDFNGSLVREFDVAHPLFPKLIPLSGDHHFTNPEPGKFRLPVFIAGARVVNQRLIVLLDLPQPEVIEYNLKGREITRYRADMSSPCNAYRGFDVQLNGNTYRLWAIVVKRVGTIELVEWAAMSE